MKLHYFDQVAPDDDDEVAANLRASGKLPEGCLLGGSLATAYLREGPACSGCAMPNDQRKRCGGTPGGDADLDRQPVGAVELAQGRLAAALRLLRRGHQRVLDSAFGREGESE